MKNAIVIVLSLLFLCCLNGFNSIAQSADDQKIRALIQKAEDAWNTHDYSYSGKYDIYAEEAVLVNPAGMYWKNRSQIIKGIQGFAPIIFQYESTKYNIKNIRFLAPAVALVIVHSRDRVEKDIILPNGERGPGAGDTTEAMYTYTLIKIDENWKVSSLHITKVDANAAPSNPFRNN
ncbi:MAG: SgcJ/EcaC family oxidoreductase [Bacteroidota bacterium]